MTRRRKSAAKPVVAQTTTADPAPTPREETGYFEAYAGFARNLRQWLLAYGVGGPALLLGQSHLVDKVSASGEAGLVTALFAVGIGAQIGLALLYKSAMWHLYICELDCRDATRWRDRLSQWLSTAYWVECTFDLVSIACFGGATWRAVVAATTIISKAG